MSEILELHEDFTGPAIGATAAITNTIFDKITGTGTGIVIADPFDATKRMLEVTASTTNRTHEMDFTPVDLLWFQFDVDIETPLTSIQAILNGYDTNAIVNKVFDIRSVANARQLQLRNVNTIAYTSPVLNADTKYRVSLYVKISTKELRMKIYSGANLDTLLSDSGIITSVTTAPSIGHLRMGILVSTTGIYRFGRLRADNAVEPTEVPPAAVDLTVDNLAPDTGDNVVLSAATTGSGTLSITQTSGPTVALTGTGNTRSFEMPATLTAGVPQSTSLTFQATYGTATDSVTVTAAPHGRWRKMLDGSRKAYVRRRYSL